MNVSIAIQAHPSRRAWVRELVAQLGPDVAVAWAERPYAKPHDQRPIWRTKAAALRLAGGAPFHCVIQDDAILAPGFRTRLAQLVEAGPYVYMLFFRMKRAYPLVNDTAKHSIEDGGFIAFNGPILGPGLVFPTPLVEDLVAFGDADPGLDGDDDRIRRWTRDRGINVYVPLPSLVDHRDGASLIGHPVRRRAWRFAA